MIFNKKWEDKTDYTGRFFHLCRRDILLRDTVKGKPRKPETNLYNFFTRKRMTEFKGSEGTKNIPPKEKMSKIGDEWADLSLSEKEELEFSAQEERDKYDVNLSAFMDKLTPCEKEESALHDLMMKIKTESNAKEKIAIKQKAREEDAKKKKAEKQKAKTENAKIKAGERAQTKMLRKEKG